LMRNIAGYKYYSVFDKRDEPYENCPTIKAFEKGGIYSLVKKGFDGHSYKITSIPLRGRDNKTTYVIEFTEDLSFNI